MHSDISSRFWEKKTLQEMDHDEWESLCDGCGHCCLIKLEDEDTNELFLTNVACRLLDLESCRCSDYEHRFEKVRTCLVLDAANTDIYRYLPQTCAYRCLAEKRSLPQWHPLITNDPGSTVRAGVAICHFAVSEEFIHPEQLPEHVIKDC